ncbi:MAG: hypothetical protein O7I93_05035 [Gemmatimonadetes bacterium]|nr:hypothetical protein [Gemmatimonadota bacterium]
MTLRPNRLYLLWLEMLWTVIAGCSEPARQVVSRQLSARPPGPTFRVRAGYVPRELRESSGVAVSRQHNGILWSHNDSRNENLLFATSLGGELRGTFRVAGATNRDWEDIALAPCPGEPGDCLYIGDTGDNGRNRKDVAIYVVPEPSPRQGDASEIRETAPAVRWTVRYDDGPEDVEALAVTLDGTVLLVTKGRHGPIRLYAVKPEEVHDGQPTTARLVREMDIAPIRLLGRWVTGAAISPNGRRMVIRTYTELFFYQFDAAGRLTLTGDCFLGAQEPQGEGVDFLDDETLVLTSEAVLGRRGPITVVRCSP